MILVDSNIPMYLIGAEHPLKPAARDVVERALAAGEILCTDAEVLQEILHRYRSLRRLEFVQPAFTALRRIVEVIYPIEAADVERAHRLIATTSNLSARDALHIAVMQAHDVGRIMSFATGFDGIPGIERLG